MTHYPCDPYGDPLPAPVRIALNQLERRALAEGLSEGLSERPTEALGARSAPRQYLTPQTARFASQRATRTSSHPAQPSHPTYAPWRVLWQRVVALALAFGLVGGVVVLSVAVWQSDLSHVAALATCLLMAFAVVVVLALLPSLYAWLCWRAVSRAAWRAVRLERMA